MTAHIFGSSGFIGSHLIKRLKQLEFNVIEHHHDQEYDIKETDYIFYLSSYGNHYDQTDPHEIVKSNITDLYDLLKITKDIDYKGFFHFSSSSVTLKTQTIYSDCKFIAEVICKQFQTKYRKPIVSLRPYSVWGRGDTEKHLIPTLIRSALTGEEIDFDPHPYHDWIHIDPFIDAVIKVMDNVEKIQSPISIGSGVQLSNLEVKECVERMLNKKVNIRDIRKLRSYDTDHWVANVKPLIELGWTPPKLMDYYLSYDTKR